MKCRQHSANVQNLHMRFGRQTHYRHIVDAFFHEHTVEIFLPMQIGQSFRIVQCFLNGCSRRSSRWSASFCHDTRLSLLFAADNKKERGLCHKTRSLSPPRSGCLKVGFFRNTTVMQGRQTHQRRACGQLPPQSKLFDIMTRVPGTFMLVNHPLGI